MVISRWQNGQISQNTAPTHQWQQSQNSYVSSFPLLWRKLDRILCLYSETSSSSLISGKGNERYSSFHRLQHVQFHSHQWNVVQGILIIRSPNKWVQKSAKSKSQSSWICFYSIVVSCQIPFFINDMHQMLL